MVKQFILFVVLLCMMMGSILLHYSFMDCDEETEKLSVFTAITQLPVPSMSTAYYEPRTALDEEVLNPAYPQMQAINRMDFIYAK